MFRMMRTLVWLACLLPAGCLQTRLPEGVVAAVNGEPIYLRTVQALLDGRTAASGAWETRSLKVMKSRYGEALGALIVNTLVRQELVRRKNAVSDEDMGQALAAIHADYGEEDFSRILADKSFNETEWRHLLRDHLSVQRFEKNILLPGIRVEQPAVRAYYQKHLEDFNLPETFDVCFASAERKEYLEAYRIAFPDTAYPSGAVSEQCQHILPRNLPPEWEKALSVLGERRCAPSTSGKQGWETLCLKQRQPAGVLSMADAYALIEQQLLEEEKPAAFQRWLETSLATADIRVSPHIKDDLLAPPLPEAMPAATAPLEEEGEHHGLDAIAN
jgi:hypothetical protein